MTHTNIVLTGFMGSGKTTVGRLVARQFQREFVDTDELLAARGGIPIHDMIARFGIDQMRVLESELCVELAERSGLVIATGGGMLVADVNRARLARGAMLFCLDASPAELTRRLSGAADRPLLNARPPAQALGDRIAELLAQREAAY